MLLRCLNSKEIKLQSSINVICITFDLIFFQLKIKRKQIFQVWHQFGHFVKCRIWHEKHTNAKKNIVYALYFQSVSFILFSFQFSGQSFVSVADGIRILQDLQSEFWSKIVILPFHNNSRCHWQVCNICCLCNIWILKVKSKAGIVVWTQKF